MKDSGQLAKEWEEANYLRALELNDMLDACTSHAEKRALYKTFTKEERNGLIPEYTRRMENKLAQVGSLVKPAHHYGMGIWVKWPNRTLSASYFGLATVIGQSGYGGHMRQLMLMPPHRDSSGTVICFAEASSRDLQVIS